MPRENAQANQSHAILCLPREKNKPLSYNDIMLPIRSLPYGQPLTAISLPTTDLLLPFGISSLCTPRK